ncbi:MAG: WD40 repeat domain-containing protein, partial [Gemmataceae bacterium]
ASPGQPVPWLLISAAIGGGLLAIVLLVGGLSWLFSGRPAGPGGPEPEPVEPELPAAPTEPEPPSIPWKVPRSKPAAVPKLAEVIQRRSLTPPYLKWILLPGPSGEYLATTEGLEASIVRGRSDPASGDAEEIGPLNVGTIDLATRLQMFNDVTGLNGVQLADISPDGLLALAVPKGVTPARKDAEVRVWAAGAAGSPLPSAGPSGPIGWLGWSASGKLLVLNGGKLVSWDANQGKVVREFPGVRQTVIPAGRRLAPTYLGRAGLAPGREWVVASSEGQHLEVLDADSGDCLGRLPGAGAWNYLLVSPDGARLAGLRTVGQSTSREPAPVEVHLWDLTSGQRQGAVMLGPIWQPRLQWVGPERLALTGRGRCLLIDAPSRSVFAELKVGAADGGIAGLAALGAGPDDRLWWHHRAWLFATPVPAVPAPEIGFGPGTVVKAEVSIRDTVLERRAAGAMTARLRRQGHEIGPGGWTLRFAATAVELGGEKMTFDAGGEVTLPFINGRLDVLDSAGRAVMNVPISGGFPRKGSKYYKRSVVESEGPRGVTREIYDFRGRVVREAILEEMWDGVIAHLGSGPWPSRFYRAGEKYSTEPPKVVLPVPPRLSFLDR